MLILTPIQKRWAILPVSRLWPKTKRLQASCPMFFSPTCHLSQARGSQRVTRTTSWVGQDSRPRSQDVEATKKKTLTPGRRTTPGQRVWDLGHHRKIMSIMIDACPCQLHHVHFDRFYPEPSRYMDVSHAWFNQYGSINFVKRLARDLRLRSISYTSSPI